MIINREPLKDKPGLQELASEYEKLKFEIGRLELLNDYPAALKLYEESANLAVTILDAILFESGVS